MRKFLLTAAAAAAVIAPATVANAETNAYVDLGLGQAEFDSEDVDTISLGGAAAFDLAPDWRVQFDVDVNRYSGGGLDFTTSNTAAHVYYEAQGWAAGGVLSNSDFIFGTLWALGLEGQVHLNSVVLEGEVGLGTLEAFSESFSTTNANANATWYVTPDFSVGAGYSYLDIDEFSDSFDTWSVDAEYKFAGTAFSAFAGWNQTDVFGDEVDGWRIGGRYAFGDDSLQGRRTTGPRWIRTNNILIGD